MDSVISPQRVSAFQGDASKQASKQTREKSVESENENLEAPRIAINFCIFHGVESRAAPPHFAEFSVAD
jgi:hypothetical protein